MSEREYNGWTNYETWAVKLWLDNEEQSSKYWTSQARSYAEDCTCRDEAVRDLARDLESSHAEANPIEGASVYADLLGAALHEVNWGEIANSFLEDEREWVEEDA